MVLRRVFIRSAFASLAFVGLCSAITNGRNLRRRSQNMTLRAEKKGNADGMRPARIYFLFMAVDKVSNLDVWNKFFAQAPSSQYRALIHCKLPVCEQSVAGSVLKPVPAVAHSYCSDLVSPMNQLLHHALTDDSSSANAADKFAFISDSTLPAKPFASLYSTLAKRQGSGFCVFPSKEWADRPAVSGVGQEVAIKAHQWIVLQREHAQQSTQMWSQGVLHNLMPMFGMNHHQYDWWTNNSFADRRNFGCLDEYWYMAALFGLPKITNVPFPEYAVALNYPHMLNGPVKLSTNEAWQGVCDTFAEFDWLSNVEGSNPFNRLREKLDKASIPHDGGTRPSWWGVISKKGLSAIRQSDFLFVRKFQEKPRLADGGDFVKAYSELVFK